MALHCHFAKKNTHLKFHDTSDEANLFRTLCINFVIIDQVLEKMHQKHIGAFFH